MHQTKVVKEPKAKRILVVEDDGDMRIVLQDRLLSMGFDVLTESNGHLALSRIALEAHQSPIQGVLLDLEMPVLSGITLLRELRDRHPEIAVIAMSAASDTAQLKEALKLGARIFLAKPFDRQRDWERIDRIFHND